MATTIFPSQTRTIDPYANYDSNVMNRLTDMITRGKDSLHSPRAVDVEIDTTSPSTYIVVKTGFLFKDGVIISVDEDFRVDMSDEDFYIAGSGGGIWDTTGIYYITANYQYVKSLPVPRLSIGILKPNQHNLFTSHYLFLKAVLVSFNGVSFEISSVHDTDPEEPDIGKRIYTQLYPGLENSVPTSFNKTDDEGRFVYVRDKASLYFGTTNTFEAVDSVRDIIDTTSCEIGQVAYIGTDGKCYPAISSDSTSLSHIGNAIVLSVGLKSDGSGKVKLSGRVDNVPVETGTSVNIGDFIYLSSIEAGSVTPNSPTGVDVQLIGRSLTASSTSISIWLMPTVLGADFVSGLSGYSGVSGFSGFSGYSGVSGFSGYSGVSGFSGYSGYSGVSGFSGYSGYSGVSGFSGYSGSPLSIYTHTQSTPSSGWNVTHNLGRRIVLSSVYNTNYDMIIPNNINLSSTSSCYVTFLTDVDGYVVVT